MPSLRITLAAVMVLGAIAPVLAADPSEACYDNAGDTKNFGPDTYQTASLCRTQCQKANLAVYGVTRGSTCFCGNEFPSDGLLDMSKCSLPCQGWPEEKCGSNSAWSFGYTGIVPDNTSKPPKSSSTSTNPDASSTDVTSTQTVIKTPIVTTTAPPGGDQQQGGGGGGTSKAGIAAGAVVGVIAVIAMGVGGFLVVRRNRRRQAEEEYRAAVAAKEFTASIRKPQADTRLDPVMLQQRRMSDGSIADNQDYSRRILKVTNPDA
ncbi:hypothetical protein TWF281_009175 [Arthrobotrys megalospora]